MLSDFIYYSQKSGRTTDVNAGIARLEKIEKTIWNWRAFTFFIDVLDAGEASEEIKTFQCVQDYKRVFPDEERAYMAEYETFKKYGDLESAENALVVAETNLAMTAQCSLTLSKIFHMRGDYDRSIESATRAILSQAETQPSSNTGAAFAHRGFAKDAKIHKAVLEDVHVDTQNAMIQSAIDDYKMAIQLGYSFNNVSARISILQKLLPSHISDKMYESEIIDRVEKLEFTLALLLKKLTSNDEE